MPALRTPRLVLEPLTAAHADEMFAVLADRELFRYLDDGPPKSVAYLRGVYERRAVGRPMVGDQRWLNLIARLHDGTAIGYVQATVTGMGSAWIAYVVGRNHWAQGYAFEATGALIDHLAAAHGVEHLMATVERDNARSIRLLERLAFRQASTGEAADHDLTPTELLYLRP